MINLTETYTYEGDKRYNGGKGVTRVTAQRKIKTGDEVKITFLGASEEEISVRSFNPSWDTYDSISCMGENFYFEVVVNGKNAYYGKYADTRYTEKSVATGPTFLFNPKTDRTSIGEGQVRTAFMKFKEWLADGAEENNYWHGLYKKTEIPEKIAYGMPGEENVVPVAETTWKTGEVIEEGDGVFSFDGIRYELFDDYVYDDDDKRKKVSALRVLPLRGEEKYSGVVSIPETVKYRRRNRTVTEVDSSAFDNCPELTELYLPKTISSFGSISGSHKLKSVVVAEGNPDYISLDGVVYSRNRYGEDGIYPKLACYPSAHGEHFVFPDFVDSMVDGAFSGCQMLKSVVLSDKLRIIRSNAFKDCVNLENVVWGKGLECIWDLAFENCISLKSIVFPESVRKVDSLAFKGCTNISSITFAKGKYFDLDSLPRELFPWGKKAFVVDGVRYAPIHEYDRNDEALLAVVDFPKEEVEANVNANIKEVIIPAHIERYGIEYEVYKCECSFSHLPSLKRLELPVTVRKINIAKMETLQEVVVDDADPDYSTVDGMLLNKDKTRLLSVPRGREDKKLVVPDGIEVIKENACSHHTHIEELIIPDSTTSIEKEAFNSCSSLHVVHLGNSVQKIGAASFAYTAIERVVLPPSARFVSPQYAWYGDSPFYASRLKAFELDGEHELYTVIDGVLYIKMQQAIGTICVSREESLNLKLRFCPPAFEGHLQIPEGVTDIIGCACSGCTELKSVFIPDGIDVIGDNAFCDCKKLERVEIDGHVNKIGSHCFWGCTSLKEIDCIGVKQIEDTAFRGIKGLKLNLPYALECKRSEIEKFIGE